MNDVSQTSYDSTDSHSCQNIFDTFDKKIRNNISSYYKGMLHADIKGFPLGGQFAHTFRFEVRSDQEFHTIYAKTCPIYESLDPARLEYQTLELLYDKMPNESPDLAVSRPIDYFPEINGYLQESVGKSDLRSYLLKNNSIFNGKATLLDVNIKLNGSARWLHAFHSITMSSEKQKFNQKEFIKSFNDEFDYNELKNFKFSKDVINQLDELIDNLSFLNDRLLMPCAKWHWDYTPGHVYIDNNKISVIDILGIDNIPVFEDIGHFLAALTSINNLPFYPFFNYKRACDSFCISFLSSYLLNSNYDKNEFLLLSNIYRLKYLIVYFLGQQRLIRQKTNPFIANLFANYRLTRLFNRPLLHTMNEISTMMNRVLKTY
ncbi:MAG: hypothetical protein OEY89_00130 [Gammaproteobacteria bacterium]|nr:hypothetical protein [Gammaproteobacteria bacterium]